jgi:hypothetical protein
MGEQTENWKGTKEKSIADKHSNNRDVEVVNTSM